MKDDDEQHIQNNVGDGRHDQKVQRISGITHCPQDTASHVINHHRQNAQKINTQIQYGAFHDITWCSYPLQYIRRNKYANQRHNKACRKGQCQRGVHSDVQLFFFSCAEIAGDDNTGSDRKSHEKADQQIDDRCTGANSRKCLCSDIIPHNNGIHCIIQLLKQIAQQQWYGKQQNFLPDDSLSHQTSVF